MKNFVFVLGAGASADLNLPIGSELTGRIAHAIDFTTNGFTVSGGNQRLLSALSASGLAKNEWLRACKMIAASMHLAPSIDNFVDVHRDDTAVAFCAKAAITHCILDAERKSTIYVDRSNIYNTINFEGNVKAWHTLFFRILTTNCVLADLPARLKSFGIITFNYDRCFEHFLLHAISAYYRISLDNSANILQSLEIYHPYGQVGELAHLAKGRPVEYGEEVSSAQLLEISKQIKTFTESVDEEASSIIRIREMASTAINLVFLGFAYHSLNVKLIFPNVPPGQVGYGKRVFGTAFRSSQSDLAIIANDLRTRYNCDRSAIDLRSDLLCSGLFSEYSRSLSLA